MKYGWVLLRAEVEEVDYGVDVLLRLDDEGLSPEFLVEQCEFDPVEGVHLEAPITAINPGGLVGALRPLLKSPKSWRA